MAQPRRSNHARVASASVLLATALGAAACDPVIDIGGSFFPAWMLCLTIGGALAALLRLVFARLGVEPYLGPLPIVYGCLGALLSMTLWLVFFGP